MEISGIGESFMRFRKKLRKKKLDFDKFNPENDDTEKWLGKELVEEGNNLLNDSSIDRNELIIRYLIQTMNWLISLEENKKLDAQIQILKRD
jgi:hypothetical protein